MFRTLSFLVILFTTISCGGSPPNKGTFGRYVGSLSPEEQEYYNKMNVKERRMVTQMLQTTKGRQELEEFNQTKKMISQQFPNLSEKEKKEKLAEELARQAVGKLIESQRRIHERFPEWKPSERMIQANKTRAEQRMKHLEKDVAKANEKPWKVEINEKNGKIYSYYNNERLPRTTPLRVKR